MKAIVESCQKLLYFLVVALLCFTIIHKKEETVPGYLKLFFISFRLRTVSGEGGSKPPDIPAGNRDNT